jgi:hypothetical protein
MDAKDKKPGLLAYLATRLGDHPEVVATTALGHLLDENLTCRESLATLLADWATLDLSSLTFRTEVTDPQAQGRPDIVGTDPALQRAVIVEGKFWAWLTDNQPVNYLSSLAPGGTLLVVVPRLRIEPIWTELIRRCGDAGRTVSTLSATGDRRAARIDDDQLLCVLSWRSLLGRFREALIDTDDRATVADVDQLDGLCDRMDTDAFLPLASLDLSNPSPLRVYQYMQLVETVARVGIERGVLSRKGLTTGGTMGQYVRYVSSGRFMLSLTVDLQRWAKNRLTPIWVEISVQPGETFRALEHETPPRVWYDGWQGRPVIPLVLPLHSEEEAVVEALYGQLVELLDLVKDSRSTWPGSDDGPANPAIVPTD